MATKITLDIIESSLNCKYKGHLKLAGQQGTKSVMNCSSPNRATRSGGELSTRSSPDTSRKMSSRTLSSPRPS